MGEDNDHYYDIKIKASKLLLDNTENTFVTPVFNGSASLRDAAGQLIENTAKSARRKQIIDEEYFETLYADMISLYRLDQIHGVDGKADLGELPGTAKWLLGALAGTWVLIGIYVVSEWFRQRKTAKQHK